MKTSLKDGIYALNQNLNYDGHSFPYWILQVVNSSVSYCNGYPTKTSSYYQKAVTGNNNSQLSTTVARVLLQLETSNRGFDILSLFETQGTYVPWTQDSKEKTSTPVVSQCDCKWHKKLIDYKVSELRIRERNINPTSNPYDHKLLVEEASSMVRRTFKAWPTCANEPLELKMRYDYISNMLVFEWSCKYHESQ